jgi:transcriptional regulator with XRE-family HTH domain
VDYSDAIRRRRARKGFSLRALARRAGLSYVTIHQIEHGLRPTPGQIAKLAKGLDTNPSSLRRAVRLSSVER